MRGLPSHSTNVTALLLQWGKGDEDARERLIPLVQRELHRIARRCMAGERVGHSLQATALVNEAYMRLVDGTAVEWHDRAHFLAVAARIMRRILVDHARARGAQKRGGGDARVTFDEALVVTAEARRTSSRSMTRWRRWRSSTSARAASSSSGSSAG